MSLAGLNPFIRYANLHRKYLTPKTRNVCYDCRLFYISAGEGKLTVGEEEYEISDSTAVYLPPSSHYRFDFSDPSAITVYVLDFDIDASCSELELSLGTATERDFSPEKVPKYPIPPEFDSPRVLKNARGISGLISEAVELFVCREPYYREIVSAKIKLALISLISDGGKSRENRLAKRIIEYIRDNFSSSDMTNEKIAEALHYHPYHLNRVIKSYTGKSLREYIIDYRLDMAKNYLITTYDSITEIASMCGFQSYTYFIKLFREKNGYSPLKYRAAHGMVGL